MSNPLKISVVTVTYNSAATLEETILSVLNQTYDNVEYIIIDGGSTDGTVDIIKKYADRLAYWVSEPDNGIYDAMNKGIAVATGDYINFMNADDTFYSHNVLSDIFTHNNYDADVIYGRTLVVSPNYTFVRKNSPLSFLKKNMAFGHQASFSKTDLMKSTFFDTRYRCAADYNFFYNTWIAKGTFHEVPTIVSKFNACDGFSAKHVKLSWKEVAIVNGNYNKYSWRIKFFFKCLQFDTKKIIKSILPRHWVSSINVRNIKAKLEDTQ